MTARRTSFVQALRERVRGTVREAEPVARYSTYRIGGPATVLLPAVAEDVAKALTLAHEAGVPWFALGLGSNILLPDEGLDALVVRLGKGLDGVQREGERWTIGAGLPAPLAARRTAEAGYGGLHIFVGVPGTVGGGVYMNAGCHGGDWSEVVERVTVVDRTGRDTVLARSEIPFTYRRSGLDGRIVLETTVRLRPEEQHRLDEAVAEMFEWRQRGTPFNQPCCGSVFKNPAGPSWKRENAPKTAGQLIESVGLKGFAIGGAQVSPMHANYFVNTGTATAADVRKLIEHVQQTVQQQFGIRLEPEVKLIGSRGEYLNEVRGDG
ncbi:MAG TPA: UDP-N-acetylmuramate dehydrogenase [Gemmatimonadales bacterium]|nr:UDP-N-acetylmuramate dehydrogenase [Gemmatimonadales bacterium]